MDGFLFRMVDTFGRIMSCLMIPHHTIYLFPSDIIGLHLYAERRVDKAGLHAAKIRIDHGDLVANGHFCTSPRGAHSI